MRHSNPFPPARIRHSVWAALVAAASWLRAEVMAGFVLYAAAFHPRPFDTADDRDGHDPNRHIPW